MNVVIEMPMGTYNKWEIKDGQPVIDRVLTIPIPANYGYVPNTLAEDNDPLDIFIISNSEFFPGDETEVEVVGMFTLKDQGIQDNKLLAKEKGMKMTNEEILSHMCKIGHYLLNYKKGIEIENYSSITKSELNKLLEKYKHESDKKG